MRWEKVIVQSLVITIALVLLPQFSFAQRRGGDVVEGLLRGFTEGQLERDRRLAVERQQLHDRQRNLRVPQPRRNVALPVEVQNYRAHLGAFTKQSAALALALQLSAGRVRGVRPLMSDALTLKTRAGVMYDQSRQVHDLALLRDEYCDLDCQWRDLSFQLQQLRGLSANTLKHIRNLNGHCDDLCRLLELEPQFDRDAVLRLTVATTTHLATLLEDVEFELYGMDGSAALVRECRGLTEQCRRLGGLCAGSSYDNLLTKYATFVSDWRRFAVNLYPHESPYCNRSIRRIRACNRQAFEQLWKPLAIDRDYFRYVSHALDNEVNSLFETMTVGTLVQMPPADQQAVLQTARELHRQCQHYCERVDNNNPLNDLMSNYVEIDRQWQTLDRYLNPVTSKSVATRRRLITAYGTELRGLLRVPTRLDRGHAIQLAASLEEMAGHLRYDTRRYGRYYRKAGFRDQAFQRSDAFYAQARDLHSQLQTGSSLEKIQARCNDAVTTWESFSRTITAMHHSGLSSNRNQILDESRQELLPVLAELATLLET